MAVALVQFKDPKERLLAALFSETETETETGTEKTRFKLRQRQRGTHSELVVLYLVDTLACGCHLPACFLQMAGLAVISVYARC